jgi:hypothetical protein
VFQKRLKNYSESVALYVAASGVPAENFLLRVGPQKFEDIRVSTRLLSDGVTVQATTCARWDFPVPILINKGASEICAQAAARYE